MSSSHTSTVNLSSFCFLDVPCKDAQPYSSTKPFAWAPNRGLLDARSPLRPSTVGRPLIALGSDRLKEECLCFKFQVFIALVIMNREKQTSAEVLAKGQKFCSDYSDDQA